MRNTPDLSPFLFMDKEMKAQSESKRIIMLRDLFLIDFHERDISCVDNRESDPKIHNEMRNIYKMVVNE